MEYLQLGHITPVRPVKIFGAADVREAFRYMQKGQHIGRIGISIRNSSDNSELAFDTTNVAREVELNDASSYLLVGGLGGLGRAMELGWCSTMPKS
jgi:hypothetical protein